MKPITHSNSPLRTTKQSSKKNKSNRSNSNFECDSQDDLQAILENVVDEEYIRKVSLAEDLNTLTILNMRVDTSIQSIYDMGVLLPNLMSLTLDYSKVSSIRDLGVGLKHIHSLSMIECNLRDIDGIGVFSLLKQLNLNDNNLNEISALAMHEVLEELHLSGNRIMDFSATDTLSSCTKLTMLTLDRNPITKSPNYHSVISTLIPTLTLLDGHAVQSTGTTPQASYSMILDAVSSMKLMEEELEDERRMEMEIMGLDDTEDRTQGIYGFHSGSMVSAGSGSGSVGNSMNMRSSVNSIGSHGGGVGANADTGSELTYGSNNAVLAGSMASALRQRRNTNNGNGNNNSNPAAATTVSQELDIAMSQSMAPNKHSASHSVESKSSSEKSQSSSAAVSGKGANPNKQQFPEELQRNSASDSKSESRMVYMEGDVTKLLTAQCEDLESSDDEVFQRPSRMGRGSGSGLGCGAGGKSKIPTANRDRTRMDGSVGALLDADSRGSAKGLSRENSGIDMSGRPPSAGIRKAPSPTARSLQRGNSFSKQNGSRPGSASRPGSNSSFASSRPDSGLSDRPGSAAIYASFKDTDMSINAPFKISAASSDTRKPMGSTMEENPETQVDTTAWALDRIAVDSDSKPSLLSLYSNSSTSLSSAWHRKDKNAKRDPKGACKSGDNSDDEGHYYYTHNTRGMRRKSRNCQPDSDDESEEESIAVTHASRHQMMTRSGSRRKITPVTLGDALSGKTTSIPSCASPQQVPSGDTISPLGEGHGVDDGASISLSASASANNSPLKEGNPHEFASPIATTPPAAFSSTVIPNSHEKSLGIGSGADTGVRTKRTFNRDSDGDSDDDVPIFGSNSGARSTSAMASLSLGFDLKNSLAAINQWVNDESESAENNNSDDSGREKKADGVRSNKIVDKHEFDQRKVEADSESDSDTPIATHIRSVGERVKVTSKLNISISGEPRVSGPGSGVGSKSKGQGRDNVLIGSMSEAEDDYGSNMDQLDDWGYDYGGFVGSNSKPNSVSKSKSKCKAPSVQQAFVTVDNKQGQSKQTIRERMDRLGNGGGAAVHSTRDYLTSDPQYLTKKSQNVMKTASVPGKGTVVRDPYDDSDSDSDLDGCVGMGGGGSSSVPLSRAELKSMCNQKHDIRQHNEDGGDYGVSAGSKVVAEPQPPQTPISPMQQMGHERRRKAHHSVESDSDGNQRLDDARTKSNVSSSTGATSCGMNMEKVVVSESSGHNLVVNPNFVDTSHDNASVHRSETPSTNTTPSSLPDSHPNRSYGARTSSNSSTTGSSCGSGVSYTDELLITILKDKPKNREELRTERNYKGFFRGMSKKRMHYLLVTAYSHATSNGVVLTEQERNDKVNKRMNLLRDVLVDDN